jgi:hypothetical protein
MTGYDLTIDNVDGEQAVMVTITGLGVEGSDQLAAQTKRAIEKEFAADQVEDRG